MGLSLGTAAGVDAAREITAARAVGAAAGAPGEHRFTVFERPATVSILRNRADLRRRADVCETSARSVKLRGDLSGGVRPVIGFFRASSRVRRLA
jgi:hypothetical protein